MTPDVGGEPVMAVIRHANRVRFVVPRNGDKHGAKDFLARQAPVVSNVRENGGDCVIAFAKGPFLGRQTAGHEVRFASLKSFLDVATHFPELLLVDDGTYVTCLIERITELERFDPRWGFIFRSGVGFNVLVVAGHHLFLTLICTNRRLSIPVSLSPLQKPHVVRPRGYAIAFILVPREAVSVTEAPPKPGALPNCTGQNFRQRPWSA